MSESSAVRGWKPLCPVENSITLANLSFTPTIKLKRLALELLKSKMQHRQNAYLTKALISSEKN